MKLSNYTPGFVDSYDQATRLCRVRIPGLTDGAEELPVAMLSYPIGDKSEHTELRILPGDRVWLDFVNGDPNFPIITGYRPKETDNAIDWRRWHHRNIRLEADDNIEVEAIGANITITAGGQVLVEAASIILRAPSITLDGPAVCTNTLTVQGLLTYQAGMSGTGPSTSNGKNVSDTHTHGGVSVGGSNTGGVT